MPIMLNPAWVAANNTPPPSGGNTVPGSNPVITPAYTGSGQYGWGAAGGGLLTLPVAPVFTGDLMVFAYFTNDPGATAISGGGVTTWQNASSFYYNVAFQQLQAAIWWGTVTTAGASTITVTDAALGANYSKMWAREFSAASANWGVAAAFPAPGSLGTSDLQTGTTVNYPSLTASAGGNDLYIGACYATSYLAASPSCPPGFFFEAPQDPFEQTCYNTSVSGAIQPLGVQATSGRYITVGAIFTAAFTATSVSSTPSYAASHNVLAGGTGTWTNPGNAQGPGDGSYASWTAP